VDILPVEDNNRNLVEVLDMDKMEEDKDCIRAEVGRRVVEDKDMVVDMNVDVID
jgi:hypothetical protein